jgi:hypothetical protein
MRKSAFIFISIIPLLLSGCSLNKFLKRPDDTNLEFWITESWSSEDFTNKGCTYLPGWFGAEEYLDSRYEPIKTIEENGYERLLVPEVHVTYLRAGYPDARDGWRITHIEITDPTIIVYGLSMNSSKEEIKNRMKELKFKENEYGGYYKNNCTFSFSDEYIVINAPSTNNSHIVY